MPLQLAGPFEKCYPRLAWDELRGIPIQILIKPNIPQDKPI